jgi:iron complex outermembrane recepter protein
VEIVVTAQRREESLAKTPVAIAVVSPDVLQKQQILTESDLQSAVSGLTVVQGTNSNQLNYSIRGQTLDAFSNSTPGVLPYVNEIQVGGAGGQSAFYDLQSVQVLKGPQGTLFGRNSTGGAVLFTTAKPTNEFGGYIEARVGDYQLTQVGGAINIPIVDDKILARLAGYYEYQEGFQYNLYDDLHTLARLIDGVLGKPNSQIVRQREERSCRRLCPIRREQFGCGYIRTQSQGCTGKLPRFSSG